MKPRDLDIETYQNVDQAWDTYRADPVEGARLARLALADDQAEIDALTILSRCTTCGPERIALLREGVRLREVAFATELAEPDGHTFWADTYSRPYMRAAHSLALELWATGTDNGRREAIRHAEHLHRINPNDNQGIRFLLLGWLPALDRWEAMERLLRAIGDDRRTDTSYWRALAAYRGDWNDADEILQAAVTINAYVPSMIAGRRPTEPLGDTVAFASREEAASYAHHAHAT